MKMDTIYDALVQFESADVWDSTYDDGVCYDRYEEEDEPIDLCMTAVQKRIPLLKINNERYGVSLVGDVAAFVKAHMLPLYNISQYHRFPMESIDENDEDAVYDGVRLVNAMEPGDASDDEYLYLLHALEPEVFREFIDKYWDKWANENKEWFDEMMTELFEIPEIKERMTKEE